MSDSKEKNSADLKKIREAKGLYNVEYLKSIGNNDKGDKAEMHKSTALMLEAKGFVKVGSKVAKKKAVKEE